MITLDREPQIQQLPVEYGPLPEELQLTTGLDYYKLTMSQQQFEKHPEAEVTFTFKNRGQQRLLDYVDPASLQQRFDSLRRNGWDQSELDFLGGIYRTDGQRQFSDEFLEFLQTSELPEVNVIYDQQLDDIAIEATGQWPLVTFWETIVMSEVNELYFENFVRTQGMDVMRVYDEGDRRLSQKIEVLAANPDIKFADFGTRRHFSLRWQKHVIERLMAECPDNFMGTSNVNFARILKAYQIGTFAHEEPMTYAGIADAKHGDIKASHHQFLEDWYDKYGADLSIALTDTFTSDFFFADFTPDQAAKWHGLRHDSGDPVEFGEQAIAFYEQNAIDPATKTIVFSDGLAIEDIVRLHKHFKDRINVSFGWGTSLTNDLGIKALNIVMKATHVKLPTGEEADLVKLSDDAGKHTGSNLKVKEYTDVFTGNSTN